MVEIYPNPGWQQGEDNKDPTFSPSSLHPHSLRPGFAKNHRNRGFQLPR